MICPIISTFCILMLSIYAFLNLMSSLILDFLSIEMQATVIDPADIGALESALDKNNVSIEESGHPLINIF